jgi:predicted metal-dependent hydrolase
VNARVEINEDLMSYRAFLLFGDKYETIIDSTVKSANFGANKCIVPMCLDKSQQLHKVILTYKKLALKWLKERTLEIAKVINASFDEFKISDTKGRWGCCTSNCCINLNWRVVCLKPALIDYVIVHELCHLREMNHSQRFWAEVEKILPDYKRRRKAVKEMSYLFQIYKDV